VRSGKRKIEERGEKGGEERLDAWTNLKKIKRRGEG